MRDATYLSGAAFAQLSLPGDLGEIASVLLLGPGLTYVLLLANRVSISTYIDLSIGKQAWARTARLVMAAEDKDGRRLSAALGAQPRQQLQSVIRAEVQARRPSLMSMTSERSSRHSFCSRASVTASYDC